MATHSQIAQDSYHDTISKMARKYSQYKLPNPSELVESDDEDDIGSNSNINSHAATGSARLEDDDDDDEEDEDILSDTLSMSMLSHKSLSSKPPYALLRKASSPSMSRSKSLKSMATKLVHFANSTSLNHVHFNPMEEIREIQMDKAYFIEIFDKYFDECKEGDVDLDEFKKGLHKLGGLEHAPQQIDIEKLFHVLLINGDGDNNSGYLQSEQFSDFLSRRFEAPQLIAYQDVLLNVIINNTKTNSSRHRLMNADDAERWDTAEVSLAEIEMRQAMEQMVDNEMEKIKVKQEFAEELERRMADPSFCNESNAAHWSTYEVAQWVSQIGYEYAMKRFFDLDIDGNVLLYDIDRNMLLNQLGISSLHCNKFMRNLNDLKEAMIHLGLSESHDVNSFEYESTHNGNELMTKVLNLQHELHKTEEKYIAAQRNNNAKIIDYESMKSSYDLVCKQLNESKQSLAALRKMNDSLSDENKKHFERESSIIIHEDNPYAFLDKMDDAMAMDEEDAMGWNCQQVAYWLTTIGMKTYLAPFMEQFVDGQILLNDINANNLITDLEVKSLHAPKIMREIHKLRNTKHAVQLQLDIAEHVSNFNTISSSHHHSSLIEELETQNSTLKTDLSETRVKLSGARAQIEEYKKMSFSCRQSDIDNTNHAHIRSESNATQKSAYSEGDTCSVAIERIGSPTPPLPNTGADAISASWHKYIQHLESKHREVTQLWMRADNNLKKYSRAIIPFQERIHNLEIQNQTRKKTIDKLNKRIDRRNETIKKLKKYQQMALPLPPSVNPSFEFNPTSNSNSSSVASSVASSVVSSSPPYPSYHIPPTHTHHNSSSMQLTQEQEMWFNNAQRTYSAKYHPSHHAHAHTHHNHSNAHHHSHHSHSQPPTKQHHGSHHHTPQHKYANSGQLLQAKKKRNQLRNYKKSKKNNIILSNDNYNNVSLNGYVSNGSLSAASIQSAPSSHHHKQNKTDSRSSAADNNSIIGSLTGITSMAYGYIMGSSNSHHPTPGNY